MAGAEGFEPPLAVLETAVLTVETTPLVEFQAGKPSLLDFLVRLVLPAERAELFKLKAFGCRLFVFVIRVVPVLALSTLERNNFASHIISLPNLRRS